MKIAIVGCGNMGMAFARSFQKYDLVKRDELLLIEKNEERSKSLKEANEGIVVDTFNDSLKDYPLVILSVKPQDFKEVASSLRKYLSPDQVVLSIMAGINIPTLQNELNHQKIIRAMPNTPAKIGMGITGYTATDNIDFSFLNKIENLINATGKTIHFDNEEQLDALTAVSGSGPAYFYYFAKSMIDAATDLGFSRGMASLLVKQTMLGSYHLINNADQTLDELISAVASKGGTTEAALNTFEEFNVSKGIKEGISNAEKRAKELSK